MEPRAFVVSLMSVVSTWMIYPSIAIFRRYAPYRFVGSWVIFSSISRFSSSVTQNFIWMFRFRFAILVRLFSHKGLGLFQQAIFVFRGRGSPKHKICQWVLAGCACYRNPILVFPLR